MDRNQLTNHSPRISRISQHHPNLESDAVNLIWDIYYLPLSGKENKKSSLMNYGLDANLNSSALENQNIFLPFSSSDAVGNMLFDYFLPLINTEGLDNETRQHHRSDEIPDTVWSS